MPVPGPQNGRYAAEPLKGLTSLTEYDSGKTKYNASVQLATDIGDTVKRIDGTEVPLLTPWQGKPANSGKKPTAKAGTKAKKQPTPSKGRPADKTGITKQQAAATSAAKPVSKADPKGEKAAAAKGKTVKSANKAKAPAAAVKTGAGKKPRTMKAPRKSGADDLKLIKGVGPKMETMLNGMGFYHWDQVGKWGPDEVAWVDQNLEGFKGRVSRDNWVAQAKKLAAGEQTEFSKRAQKN